MDRIKTGIFGLDEKIEGGFEKGSLIEVAGSEGTFKSTFGLQFAIEGIRNNEKVTYISLEEPKESYKKTAINLGWENDFAQIEFRTIDINDVLRELSSSDDPTKGSEELARLIMDAIDNPDRLIIDTATTLALYSSKTGLKDIGRSNWMYMKPSPGDIRMMLFYLANECRKKGNTTALFLAESGEGDLYIPEQVLKYISDTKIELKKSMLGTESPRTLSIHKMRHTKHPLDELPMNLTEQGLTITTSDYVLEEQHA